MADKPVTREEKYLAYLTGDYKGKLPKPITRKEKYLYELCLKGIGGEISPEEIKNAVNEYLEKNPVKPGATTEQAQQIEQNKTDITSLKTDLGDLDNSIDGDSFLRTLATISTELFYNSYYWFIPLNLYNQGDTILVYFPTIANGTYSTYFCNENKSAAQAVEVAIVNHLASVVYPKFGKTYSFLRMPGEKETDLCYLKKKNATIFDSIDSLTQKNVVTLFADNTGNTDVSHDVQMLINSMESDGEVEIYFPKGKYLFFKPNQTQKRKYYISLC